MYNTKFECRYHKDDVFLETDVLTDEEKAMVRDILYKEDVLNVFSIDFNDDSIVFENAITSLYEKIKHYQPLKNCMKKMAATILSEDEQMGLVIMYSYDYMYIIHKCVSDYLETSSISEQNMIQLNKICE